MVMSLARSSGSTTLPGVSATATCLPQLLARQWISVDRPPREMLAACVHSPQFVDASPWVRPMPNGGDTGLARLVVGQMRLQRRPSGSDDQNRSRMASSHALGPIPEEISQS